jgi:hypothetical protein
MASSAHELEKIMLTLALLIGGWISSGRAPSTFLRADLAVQLQQMMNAPITLQHVEEDGQHRWPSLPSHLTPHRVKGLISP